MTKEERWQRLEALFHEALGLPPEGRPAYLESKCRHDSALRQSLETMLAHAAGEDRSLANAIQEAAEALVNLKERSVTVKPGDHLGDYEIIRGLGSGGMGRVYLARDRKLGRNVALKLLHSDVMLRNQALERFQNEAVAAAALNHPNILTVYDLKDAGGKTFIVSEYVDGITLRQRLATVGRMAIGELLRIAVQVADGVGAAHQKAIVHRDLKPENILIRRQDECVKIVDFGLSKSPVLPENVISPVRTDSGFVLGTLLYMSPEQMSGAQVTPASDVWSLGVILYELACGRHPFISPTPSETAAHITRAEIPEMPLNVPPALQRIIRRALAREPDARYPSALPMAAELGAIVAADWDLSGDWKAEVTYDWRGSDGFAEKCTEVFRFQLDGNELYGTASFLGTKKILIDGKLNGTRLSFITKQRLVMDTTSETYEPDSGGFGLQMREVEKEEIRRYRGRIVEDKIHFVLEIYGGFSEHVPIEFVASKVT